MPIIETIIDDILPCVSPTGNAENRDLSEGSDSYWLTRKNEHASVISAADFPLNYSQAQEFSLKFGLSMSEDYFRLLQEKNVCSEELAQDAKAIVPKISGYNYPNY